VIRITTLYPRTPDARFDFDYYLNGHMELSKKLLTDFGMTAFEVERCVQNLAGEEPDYICITHVDFEDLDRLREGIEMHAQQLQEDFPKYTNIDPEVQICEVFSTWTGNNR